MFKVHVVCSIGKLVKHFDLRDFSTYIKKKLLGYYFLTSHNEKTKSNRILYLII